MSTAADLGFIHVFRPPPPQSPILLMLHGTGGNEHDLVPLADMLWPNAGVLSPRGKVLEHGMPRFFRRLAEGVFDLDDLRQRTIELGDFVASASTLYGFETSNVIAVGFSNGANIASSLLLTRPSLLGGAVLFRGMVPFVPKPLPAIPKAPVLLSNGRTDPLVPVAETNRLVALLRDSGADVTLMWQNSGHDLTPQDVADAKRWLEEGRSGGSGG